MSSRYKFEFTGMTDTDELTWMLTSRHGVIWTGTMCVGDVPMKNTISFDMKIDHPKNTPIPHKGMTLIKERARGALYGAVRYAEKLYRQRKLEELKQ